MPYAIFYFKQPDGAYVATDFSMPLCGPADMWAEYCQDFMDESGRFDAYQIYDAGGPIGKMVFQAN